MTLSEALGFFGLVYIIYYLMNRYISRTYHKFLQEYQSVNPFHEHNTARKQLNEKIVKLLKVVNIYCCVNRHVFIKEIRDGLYWLLGLIAYENKDIKMFLNYINKINTPRSMEKKLLLEFYIIYQLTRRNMPIIGMKAT